MFFINKDNIVDFQNRCVVALFLDSHPYVIFDEYVGKNHFRGRLQDEKRTLDIYIFNSPKKSEEKEDQGIVFKYKGRKAERKFRYIDFSNGYLEEYVEFKNNPYDFICRNFVKRDWQNKYNTLLISDEVELDANSYGSNTLLVKYKSEPSLDLEDDMIKSYFSDLKNNKFDPQDETIKKLNYFMNALKGELAFTKPEWVNDPFDCDCDISVIDIFPSMLRGAMLSTKYHFEATTAIDDNKLQEWWNGFAIEDKQKVASLFDKLSFGKKGDFNERPGSDEARTIIEQLYRKYENKKLSIKKIDLILERYCSMRDRLTNLKKEFRILSLAHSERDILMWGYYGNSGQGVCLRHNPEDLRKGIIESSDAKKFHADFCIYGKMKYESEKPQFNPTSGVGVDGILEYIVECVFTKYKIWRHEDEYRYVLMGENVKDSEAICIQSKVEHRFMGVKYDDVKLYKYFEKYNAWPDNKQNVGYLKKNSGYELINKL